MEKHGCRGVTGRICENKFKNLKRKYVSLKTYRQRTGTEGPSKWPHYNLLDELLQKDRAINPEHVMEVGSGTNRIRKRVVN